MRIRFLSIAAAALVLSFAASARADMLPSIWNVSGTFSSPGFSGFSDAGSGPPDFLYGNGANYYLVGDATLRNDLNFNNTPYTAQLTLQVGNPYQISGQSGTYYTYSSGSLTFTGLLNGASGAGGSPGTMTNTITGLTQQSIEVGNHHFDVSLVPFMPSPPSYLIGNSGSFANEWSFGNPSYGYIYASITEDGVVLTPGVPEPSALMLAILGLFSCSAAAWRNLFASARRSRFNRAMVLSNPNDDMENNP